MAIQHPDQTGGVIILGGAAKFISVIHGKPVEYPLEGTIHYTDSVIAPVWFKTMSKKSFDDGNYLPEIYSLNNRIAHQLWKQTASVPVPVMVHYACEFFASDVTLELSKIKCPVLVLRAMFNDAVLKNPINNYVQPQFIDAWNKAAAMNSLFTVIDVPEAAACVWKDKPAEVYSEINLFIKSNFNNKK